MSGLNYIDSLDESKSWCGCPARAKFHIFQFRQPDRSTNRTPPSIQACAVNWKHQYKYIVKLSFRGSAVQFILVNSDIHISACCNFNKCTGSTHQKDFVCITCLLSLTTSEFGIPSNRINSCFSNTHQHHPSNPSDQGEGRTVQGHCLLYNFVLLNKQAVESPLRDRCTVTGNY